MRQVTKNKIWTTSVKKQNQSQVYLRYQCLRWQLCLSRYVTSIHQLCSTLPWISGVAQTLHNSRDNRLETSRLTRWSGQRAFLCFKSVPGNEDVRELWCLSGASYWSVHDCRINWQRNQSISLHGSLAPLGYPVRKSLAFRLRFITNGTQFSGLHSVKLIQRFGYLTSKKHM